MSLGKGDAVSWMAKSTLCVSVLPFHRTVIPPFINSASSDTLLASAFGLCRLLSDLVIPINRKGFTHKRYRCLGLRVHRQIILQSSKVVVIR